MIEHLKLLVYKAPELTRQIGDQVTQLTRQLGDHVEHILECDQPKELVRYLVEHHVDIVIAPAGELEIEKAEKIMKTYHCPFFFIGDEPEGVRPDLGLYWTAPEDLGKKIDGLSKDLEILRLQRANGDLKHTMNSLVNFDVEVGSVAKEIFISEIKEYFRQSLRAKECYWVDLPKPVDELPPILLIKQELQRQKISMEQVVKQLDLCDTEILTEPTFQIWKQGKGKFLALIWLEVGYKYSQCLILEGIEFNHMEQLSTQLQYVVPTLNRRWNICCAVQQAQDEVYLDSLTKLYNQKFLNEILAKKIEENKRYKTPFTILFIDVDHFKMVNDSLGHVVGSKVLIELGNLIYGCIRGTDYAFRYGGDEFIVLLGHTAGENADVVAERIREKVEDAEFKVNDKKVKITVSIGLASYPKHASSAEEIIQIADEAMYYGKNKSRNIVYKAS